MARVTHLNINHRGADGATLNADDLGITAISGLTATDIQGALGELTYGPALQSVALLTNKSGGSVDAGDVLIIDTANVDAFTTTTTADQEQTVMIALETIAANATGLVLTSGSAAVVNTNAVSTTRGHYLFTSTGAKIATASATRGPGAFGQVISGGADPEAIIWGVGDEAGSPVSDITDLPTAETDTTKRLAPDGVGGVQWGTGGGGSFTVDVQAFNTPGDGTWTKPAGALYVYVAVVGGGGGGSAGRKGNASTTRMGGGGGGGGGISTAWFDAADLGSSEKYTVATGGGGASGQSSNSSNGGVGSAGLDSFFGNSATGDGSDAKILGGGGPAGHVGDATGVAATWTGPGGWPWWDSSSLPEPLGGGTLQGGGGSFTSTATSPGPNGGDGGGAGGGGCGGSVTSGNTVGAGGKGGLAGGRVGYASWPRATGSGATSGTPGGTGADNVEFNGIGGNGGGGGGASITGGTDGADGGPGGWPGGGGGGGGAALSSVNNSGGGGDGANGLVLIVSLTG